MKIQYLIFFILGIIYFVYALIMSLKRNKKKDYRVQLGIIGIIFMIIVLLFEAIKGIVEFVK